MAGETFHDVDTLEAEAQMDEEELFQEWLDEMVADRAMTPNTGTEGLDTQAAAPAGGY